MQVLPLQLASLLLVTLPWTLPRLLDLQAANPVAVLDGMSSATLNFCPCSFQELQCLVSMEMSTLAKSEVAHPFTA